MGEPGGETTQQGSKVGAAQAIPGGILNAQEEIPKSRNPQTWALAESPRVWSFPSGLLGSLPIWGSPLSSQLIPVFHLRGGGRWEGEMAGPRQILRTLPASVAMAMLLFLSRCS